VRRDPFERKIGALLQYRKPPGLAPSASKRLK
jgi:hypothetical protein